MAKNFPRDVADKLLDKLSSDDDFRELFQSDPRAALAKVGHVTPEADVGVESADPVVCCAGAKLASKEEIRKGRQKLLAKLTGPVFTYDLAV